MCAETSVIVSRFQPPRCRTQHRVVARKAEVSFRAQPICHSERSEESNHLAHGQPPQILHSVQNDMTDAAASIDRLID